MKFIFRLTSIVLATSGLLFSAGPPIQQVGESSVLITPDSLRELDATIGEASFGDSGPTVTVPPGSILDDNGKTHVFLQSPDNPERFDLIEVTLGKPTETGLEILTGLFPGDRIIVRNLPYQPAAVAAAPEPAAPAILPLAPEPRLEPEPEFPIDPGPYRCPFEEAAFHRDRAVPDFHAGHGSRHVAPCPYERSTREYRHRHHSRDDFERHGHDR